MNKQKTSSRKSYHPPENTPGPWHDWFAWHPVNTNGHGWRWLRTVYRRRTVKTSYDHGTLYKQCWEYELYVDFGFDHMDFP